MKRTQLILISVTLIITLGLAGASCAPTPTPTPPSPTSGTVEVGVTDAPPKDNVTSIMVTASKVEIHKATAEQEQQTQSGDNQTGEQQQVEQGEGEWLIIDIADGANSFDLLEIKGIEKLLATSEVEAGKYTQVRLIIDKIEVALGDGEPKPAIVPSGELKFVHPFDVVAGEKTTILLDFDANKSVNITGKGKIQIRPVVKLTVQQESSTSAGEGIRVVSEDESKTIAEDFMKNCPTFVFDGIADTLRLTETVTLRSPYSWQFVFEFESRHAGYGDRTGQILAQMITPHKAVITVIQGEITRAVMDDKWDMLKQQEIGSAT